MNKDNQELENHNIFNIFLDLRKQEGELEVYMIKNYSYWTQEHKEEIFRQIQEFEGKLNRIKEIIEKNGVS